MSKTLNIKEEQFARFMHFTKHGEFKTFILLLLIGLNFGYLTFPKSESWVHAGLSFNMRQICIKLVNEKFHDFAALIPLEVIGEPVDELRPAIAEHEEAQGTEKINAEGVAIRWDAAWQEAVILKLCYYDTLVKNKVIAPKI